MNALAIKKTFGDSIEGVARYVSQVVSESSGNVFGDKQQSMVINRLKKRMIDLGGLTPAEYLTLLDKIGNTEFKHLIGVLTTHHTAFFREFCHFEYLLQNFGQFVDAAKKRGDKKIRIYSAACSKGQEVYSLAMFMEYHLKAYPGMGYEILGTDIDLESVKFAERGIYPYLAIKSIPQNYMSGQWQRGTGEISHFVKVRSHLKEHCKFATANLLDLKKDIPQQKFDIIFCRNVFIYFDAPTIAKTVNALKNYLHESGVLFTGLSESLKTLSLPKTTHGPSIYSFGPIKEDQKTAGIAAPDKASKFSFPKPIRVLVVDDSQSVVKLLSRIFNNDPAFELAGVAYNGKEAETFLKNNTVDAMTLDIHMPEMDGVSYLEKNFTKNHPKVVMVSSASREDTRYAQKALSYGAHDFVEKPAMNNLAERAEEICMKIKMTFMRTDSQRLRLDREFEDRFQIDNIENKARLLIGGYGDIDRLSGCVKELQGQQPPVFVLTEGAKPILGLIQDKMPNNMSTKIFEEEQDFSPNTVYLCDFETDSVRLKAAIENSMKSVAIYGISSQKVESWVTDIGTCHLMLEDLPGINKSLVEVASDIFPATSFAHVGSEALAKDS